MAAAGGGGMAGGAGSLCLLRGMVGGGGAVTVVAEDTGLEAGWCSNCSGRGLSLLLLLLLFGASRLHGTHARRVEREALQTRPRLGNSQVQA